MRNIRTLAKKELDYYLNSPLAYLITVPFILVSYFLYFKTTFVYGQANLRPYFELLPWFLIVLAPALTMQSLTEEKNKKTLEILLAHPLSETEIVLSKFLGSFLFYSLIILTTVSLTFPLFFFSKPDWGELLAQYLGALLLGSLFLSLGLLASSLFENVMGSFLLASLGGFFLLILGVDVVSLSLPSFMAGLVNWFSVSPHLQAISRGLIDLADVSYFFTLTAVFLIVSVYQISKSKIDELKPEKRKLQTSLVLTLVLGILLNVIFVSFPWRLDLTTSKIYSLSPALKNLIRGVDDRLTIKLYSSPDLPPSAQIVLKQTRDFLTDVKRLNRQITIVDLHPQNQNADAQAALRDGLTPIQFNTIGASSYQVQQGFLGLSFRYLDKSESLPFVAETQSLEYKLAQIIKRLTNKNRHLVALYQSSGDQTANNFSRWQTELSNNFNLTLTSLDKDLDNPKPDLLIIQGLKSTVKSDVSDRVQRYLGNGGRALLLLDKISASANANQATPITTGLEPLLTQYGLTLNSDLAYDLNLAETVQVSGASANFLLPYPFWIKALPADPNFPPTAQIRSLDLFWPSSLTLNATTQWQVNAILKTTARGGLLTGNNLIISPTELNQIDFSQSPQEVVLGAVVKDKASPQPLPKLALITDSDFLADSYLNPNSSTLAFATNLVDYLASGSNEIVPIKAGNQNIFIFTAPWQPALAQWATTLLTAAVVLAFGILRLWRRHRNFNRIFNSSV